MLTIYYRVIPYILKNAHTFTSISFTILYTHYTHTHTHTHIYYSNTLHIL